MKYIFLDIDGVLNCREGREEYLKNPLDENKFRNLCIQGVNIEYVEVKLLRRLHEIVYKTGAVIVGVSSWFWYTDHPELDYVNNIMFKILGLPIYATSNCIQGGKSRGEGVLSWLKENNYNENNDSFIVIDDSDDFYSFDIRKITPGKGISNEDVKYFIKELEETGKKI